MAIIGNIPYFQTNPYTDDTQRILRSGSCRDDFDVSRGCRLEVRHRVGLYHEALALGQSMGWFKGKSTGNHRFSH